MRALRFLLEAVFGLSALLLAGVCAVAASLAHFGRTDLEADILTHFAPLWLAGALVAATIALVLLRSTARWLIVGAAAIAAIASLMLIVPEYGRDAGPRASASAPGQLKVIQFNVWKHNPEVARTIDWIVAEQPDVLILEEASPEFRRALAARTAWRATCERCDTAVISRLPMSEVRQLRGDGPLVAATLRDRRGPFTVVALHNAWPTDGSDQQRQEARLAKLLSTLPRDRAIVGGDFNSAPWSFSRRRWDDTFGVVRRERALFSWPARPYKRLTKAGAFPFLPIDHVYAGTAWGTVGVKRGPRLGSDHYPVVMTLAPLGPR